LYLFSLSFKSTSIGMNSSIVGTRWIVECEEWGEDSTNKNSIKIVLRFYKFVTLCYSLTTN